MAPGQPSEIIDLTKEEVSTQAISLLSSSELRDSLDVIIDLANEAIEQTGEDGIIRLTEPLLDSLLCATINLDLFLTNRKEELQENRLSSERLSILEAQQRIMKKRKRAIEQERLEIRQERLAIEQEKKDIMLEKDKRKKQRWEEEMKLPNPFQSK